VLEWAAAHGRLVVINDARMMIGFAKQRIETGLPMPGLVSPVSRDAKRSASSPSGMTRSAARRG